MPITTFDSTSEGTKNAIDHQHVYCNASLRRVHTVETVHPPQQRGGLPMPEGLGSGFRRRAPSTHTLTHTHLPAAHLVTTPPIRNCLLTRRLLEGLNANYDRKICHLQVMLPA